MRQVKISEYAILMADLGIRVKVRVHVDASDATGKYRAPRHFPHQAFGC